MHISLFKVATISTLISFSHSAAIANDSINPSHGNELKPKSNYEFTQQDLDNIKRSKALMDQARKDIEAPKSDLPSWATTGESDVSKWAGDFKDMNAEANVIRSAVLGVDPNFRPKDIKLNQYNKTKGILGTNEELILFASFNMPKQVLRNMLTAASKEGGDVSIVFRGMREEDSAINQTSLAIRRVIDDLGLLTEPNVKMDPRLFYQYGINSAPSMVYRNGNKTVVASGLETFETFIEQSRNLNSGGNLGTLSVSYAIKEVDVIEVIKERLSGIDWEQKKKDATRRYIARNTNFNLPELTGENDIHYIIDPRVKFTREVKSKDGTHFASAGDIVDPTQLMDQPITMYVLDSTSEKQREFVKQQLLTDKSLGLKHILLSKIEESDDFEPIKDMQHLFKQQIFILQPDMYEKFKLEHTPAKIQIKKGIIQITEFGTRSLLGLQQEKITHES
ncbi:hypothetical protein H5185_08615 [Shewanella sp. SG44-6]|uniref:TrbC family F-type conjugative pilus assembly protein n=1 Tax=Shewanella sp. SG44-6 TaxID=2760959 RepID=UPI001602EE75|nr:TrbC family F-type conjugative pilus assembly protein [Shewanella sp. SG44-6]MBB1389483.1 hypothetical protein [Shewanella sp. SG44-6]